MVSILLPMVNYGQYIMTYGQYLVDPLPLVRFRVKVKKLPYCPAEMSF